MKIVIDGLTEDMVDALCRKWGYSVTAKEEVIEERSVPDPDPEAEEGAVLVDLVPVLVDVPNPQSKEDFVKEYAISFLTNEYRLVVRQDETEVFNGNVEKKVKEVKLK